MWIWQCPDWPAFHWQEERIQLLLRTVRLKQGVLLGKASASGQDDPRTTLNTLLQNIITSSAIEGEELNAQSVRSSLAKRLGLGTQHPTSNRSEGLADILLDAIDNRQSPLDRDRLFQWHRWLFPESDFYYTRIRVGQLRGDEPMQVVSGRIDRPTIHFEAPPGPTLDNELTAFIDWFNHSRHDSSLDPLLRAALCHFWFVTLHPFEDGNGRITRTLTDLALAQADSQSIRLYTMAAAILEQRQDYYRILEQCQRGSLDITEWLIWFLNTLDTAIQSALDGIERTLQKTRFWKIHHASGLSEPQIKVLNRMLDGGDKGFEMGISAAQYQKVAKVSKATATRHLSDLIEKGCLEKLPGGGRSTRYRVIPPPNTPPLTTSNAV